LNEAFDSSLSVYCWLQIESRKIILEHLRKRGDEAAGDRGPAVAASYFSLLEDALPEHQWVFREVFLYGKSKEDLALESGRDLSYVTQLLRECLGMIRKNLG
jgi:hypothetical protein